MSAPLRSGQGCHGNECMTSLEGQDSEIASCEDESGRELQEKKRVRGVQSRLAEKSRGLSCKDTTKNVDEQAQFVREVVAAGRLAAIADILKSPTVQKRGWEYLDQMASSGTESKHTTLDAGGLNTVLRGLRENVQQSDVIRSGLQALQRLLYCQNTLLQRYMPTLINDRNTGDAQKAAEDGNFRKEFVKAGGVGLILSAMTEHSANASVQIVCCAVLHDVAMSEEGNHKIVEDGGLQVVLQAMDSHLDDAEVQQSACALLRLLSCVDQQRKNAVLQSGGLRAIVNCLRRHQRHVKVQTVGCGALAALVCPPFEVMANAIRVGEQPKVPAPADCLAKFQKEGQDIVVLGGGLSALIQAMRTHAGTAAVQEACLLAFFALFRTDNTEQVSPSVFVNHRAVMDVIVAIQRFSSSRTIQFFGLGLLESLAQGDMYARRAVLEAGGVEAACKALKTEDLALQFTAVRTLESMVGEESSEGKNAVVASGGARAIIAAMRLPKACPRVVKICQRTLHELSDCEVCYSADLPCSQCTDRRQSMEQDGVIGALLESMAHGACSQQKRTLLGHLPAYIENGRKGAVVGGEEAMALIVAQMREHTDCPELLRAACVAVMSFMARESTHLRKLLDSGAPTVLFTAATQHLQSTGFHAALWLVVASLAGDKEFSMCCLAEGVPRTIVQSLYHDRTASDLTQEKLTERLHVWGTRALVALMLHGEVGMRAVSAAGGTDAIVHVMGLHSMERELQATGISAVSVTVPFDLGRSDGRVHQITLDTISRATEHHPSLRDKGLRALHLISDSLCFQKRREHDAPASKRQRTCANSAGNLTHQCHLKALPSALLGEIWPSQRAVMGSQACRWLREVLTAHASSVLFTTDSNLQPSSALTENEVGTSITHFSRSTVTLVCGEQADGHFLLSLMPPRALSRVAHLHLSCPLGLAHASMLAEALNQCRTLETLDVAECALRWKGAKALFSGDLAGCAQLQTLKLQQNQLGDAGLAYLASALEAFKALTYLDVSGNDIGEHGAHVLARALAKQCPGLQSLFVRENALGWAGGFALAAALPTLTQLKVLDIASNDIGNGPPDGVETLAQCVGSCECLEELYVCQNALGEAGTATLLGGLERCTSLVRVTLAENEIGDAGARCVADALKAWKLLNYLDLEGNQIGAEGLKAIAGSLGGAGAGSRLHHLALGDNHIGSEGVEVLAGVLAGCSLRFLHLGLNGIGDQGAVSLACVLARSSSTLQHLTLEHNQIGDAGFRALAEAVAKGKIRELDVNSNEIGRKGVEGLVELVKLAPTEWSNASVNLWGNGLEASACVALIAALSSASSTPPSLRLCSTAVLEISEQPVPEGAH